MGLPLHGAASCDKRFCVRTQKAQRMNRPVTAQLCDSTVRSLWRRRDPHKLKLLDSRHTAQRCQIAQRTAFVTRTDETATTPALCGSLLPAAHRIASKAATSGGSNSKREWQKHGNEQQAARKKKKKAVKTSRTGLRRLATGAKKFESEALQEREKRGTTTIHRFSELWC